MPTLNSFEKSVLDTVKKFNMISPGDKIVVGLSGGADSSVLLFVLKKLSPALNFEICAAHLNHAIRGKEAERDQYFSENFAKMLGIPFYTKTVSVPEYAKENHLSEETAGRTLRYDYFHTLCSEHGFNKIAVAHNVNDKAESVILNLIRGCGVQGLKGIRAINNEVIRPLIDAERKEIEAYAAKNKINFVTDSSNFDNIYSRNIVRNSVFCELEKINKMVVRNISRCSNIVSDENDFMISYIDTLCAVEKCREGVRIKRKIFDVQHVAVKRRIILKAIELLKGDMTNTSLIGIDSVLSASRTGSEIQLSGGLVAIVEPEFIVLPQKAKKLPEYEYGLTCGSIININEIGLSFETALLKMPILPESNAMYLNYDKLGGKKLILRSRKDGDVFSPSGMNGSKKVKKFFIDNKIPISKRGNYPIFTANGEIAAVVPLRVDRNYIIDNTTENVLMIKVMGGHNG